MDHMACIHQPLASFVNVVNAIGEMTKIAPAIITLCLTAVFRGPIISQLNFCLPFLPGMRRESRTRRSTGMGDMLRVPVRLVPQAM